MSRPILVTGAAGFIGSHLMAELHAAGRAVVGVDTRTPAQPGGDNDPELLHADAACPRIVGRIERGEFGAVLHQAAITDTLAPDSDALEYANVVAPLRLADACVRGGALFVYASSGSVYGAVPHGHASRESDPDSKEVCGGPLNAYARSKLRLDRAMLDRDQGLRWAGLRYTNVFGPGEDRKGPMASILSQIVAAAAAGRPVRVFHDTLEAARDYLPVTALTETVAELLRGPVPSGVYNLGSGVPVSFATLLRWCATWRDGLSVELIPNPIPDRYQYWTCADRSALATVLPGLAPITRADIHDHAQQLFESYRGEQPAAAPRPSLEVP